MTEHSMRGRKRQEQERDGRRQDLAHLTHDVSPTILLRLRRSSAREEEQCYEIARPG